MKRLLLFVLAFASLAGCRNQLDDGTPRLYKCERDGGEACPGGWKCGLEGYCQDPNQALPYKCEHSSDCVGGWHCGIHGVCYSPETTTEECRQDAGAGEGSDCAEGWRCGLNRACHQVDLAGPYQCASDSDCEAGWRCGQENVCVDVKGQELGAQTVSVSVTKLSPAIPEAVEQVAMTPALSNGVGGNLSLAWSQGSNVSVFLAGPTDFSNVRRFDVVLPAPPSSLALSTIDVYASGTFGVVRVSPTDDGGTVNTLSTSATSQLIHDEGMSYSGTVVAYSPSALTALLPFTTSFPGAAPSGVTLNSVTPWPSRSYGTSGATSLLAATNQGIYFAPHSGTFFYALDGGVSNGEPQLRPVTLPTLPSACTTGAPNLARVKYLEAQPPSYGPTLVAATGANDSEMYIWERAFGAFDDVSECASLDQMSLVWGPCSPCGQGETLVDYGMEPTNPERWVETLCRDSSGGLVRYKNAPVEDGGVGCPREQLPIRESAAQGMTVATATQRADGLDRIGMPLTCAGPECDALLWDGIADRAAGNGDSLLVFSPLQSGPNGLLPEQGAWMWKGVGLVPLTAGSVHLAGGVAERPDLAITGGTQHFSNLQHGLSVTKLSDFLRSDPFINLGNPSFADLRNSSDYVPVVNGGVGATGTSEVAHGVVATDADGGQWLAIGVGDRIWAAPGAEKLDQDGGMGNIDIKLVPLSFGRLQSLTLGAPPSERSTKELLEGYAVVSQRLFRITVPSEQLWLSDEIRLQDAVPLKVWREDTKGRVGTADGRVYGLPIPVQIAPPVPGGVAVDFADLCGQGIALTPTGAFRLVGTGGALGTWEPIDLASAVPVAAQLGATWVPPLHVAREGKLHKVILMNKLGLVMQLQAQCGD